MANSGDRLAGFTVGVSPWRRRRAVRPPKACCSIGHIVLLLAGVTVGFTVGYSIQVQALGWINSLSPHTGPATPAVVAVPHHRAFLAVTQPDFVRGTAYAAAGRRDPAWTDSVVLFCY